MHVKQATRTENTQQTDFEMKCKIHINEFMLPIIIKILINVFYKRQHNMNKYYKYKYGIKIYIDQTHTHTKTQNNQPIVWLLNVF